MPFILRNVTLAGVNSGPIARARRIEAWRRLGMDLDLAKLDAITVTRKLGDVIELAEEITQGKVRGRMVLEVD
jgi:acrylyl-CoA reductase (NADPH)